MSGSSGARLVIEGGPRGGERYPLRLGDQVIGRADTADVILGAGDVSREHAHIWWDGATATITDAGSSHGTEVNRYRVVGSQTLRRGDLIRLGSAELRFETADAEQTTGPLRSAPSEGSPAGGVGNQVGRDNYGDIIQAGRDVNYDYDVDILNRLEPDDPMDELFKGRGVGRLLMAIGLLIALAGFGGWMYLILSGGATIAGGRPVDPFSIEVFGVPAAMVAFGSFLVGGVIASIGKGMSKAARERAERSAGDTARARRRVSMKGGAAMVQISNTIGGNNFGDITQGGRDVVVTKVVSPDPRQALNAVRSLRGTLDGLEVPEPVRSEAGRALDEIEEELRIPEPDRGVITARLERFTEVLTSAGAVASAGASLIRPIRAIAAWLGPIGAALLRQVA